jgi:hypothetical protein
MKIAIDRLKGTMVSSSSPGEDLMSEEQLGRIESAVVRIESTVEGLKTDVAGLKTDVGGLKTDVGGLKADVARLDAGQIELRRHMLLLHEVALDRIAAQGFPAQAGTTATKQDLRDLEERINRRLDPIEWAIKSHSAEIADLQRCRDAR